MSEPIPIYSGKPEDFTWVGFGSGSGTNLRECAARVQPPAFIFSDRPKSKIAQTDPGKLIEYDLEALIGVPRIVMDGFRACGSWKKAKGNPEREAEYRKYSQMFNQDILDVLRHWEDENDREIDLIVLGGYMRFIMDPLLEAYADRFVNVHPSDGSFVGEDAVYDAIRAGQKTTRSSVLMVDESVDNAEQLVLGEQVGTWVSYACSDPGLKERFLRRYTDLHQDLQKEHSDWPALTAALRFIRDGRLALGTERTRNDGKRDVYFDGRKMYGTVEVDRNGELLRVDSNSLFGG